MCARRRALPEEVRQGGAEKQGSREADVAPGARTEACKCLHQACRCLTCCRRCHRCSCAKPDLQHGPYVKEAQPHAWQSSRLQGLPQLLYQETRGQQRSSCAASKPLQRSHSCSNIPSVPQDPHLLQALPQLLCQGAQLGCDGCLRVQGRERHLAHDALLGPACTNLHSRHVP